jgi:polar amino acid transport system substrate-binding protein
MKHTTHPLTAKASRNRSATWWRLNLLSCVLLLVAFWQPSFAENPKSGGFPSFRHVDLAATLAETSSGGAITLLADDDFAPWSFRGADGRFQGVSVELAQQACAEAGYTCEIRPAAFATILTALEKADAQGVVSGPKLDAALASKFALTRPYFQSLGRFVIRTGSPLSTPDIRSLAGRRIGFRNNSAHGKFLETFYGRSALIPFETQDSMLEALRTGQVDVIFGDAVQLSFWLQGSASRGCCSFLGKAFMDRASFTRSLSFILRRDDPKLRINLDTALDRLESKGAIAAIFARYLPASLW